MPDSTTVFQRVYRAMRIVYFAIFAHIVVVIWIALTVPKQSNAALDRTFVIAIAIVAAAALAICATIRQKLIEKAEALLQSDPNDKISAGKWNAGTVIGSASCDAVALFGLVLAFLGASKTICAMFWAAAIVAMLFMRPRMIGSGPFKSGPISRN